MKKVNDLIDFARLNASTDWEMQFVDDVAGKVERFGGDSLTEAQLSKLVEIAGEDEDEWR